MNVVSCQMACHHKTQWRHQESEWLFSKQQLLARITWLRMTEAMERDVRNCQSPLKGMTVTSRHETHSEEDYHVVRKRFSRLDYCCPYSKRKISLRRPQQLMRLSRLQYCEASCPFISRHRFLSLTLLFDCVNTDIQQLKASWVFIVTIQLVIGIFLISDTQFAGLNRWGMTLPNQEKTGGLHFQEVMS